MVPRDFISLFIIYFCLINVNVKADDFQLPSYFHPCYKLDPTFNDCIINNVLAFLPEIINGNETLHIPNLNPLIIPQISIKQGNKQIGLNMAVEDAQIYGIRNMKIIELNLNMDTKYMKTRCVMQHLEILGKHKTVGNIVVVKVYGEGKFNITAENVDYTYETTFDYEKKNDGYEYAVTKTQKVTMNDIGRVIFNLENMFGDDKLDMAVNDLLNQHWRLLAHDLFHEMTEELLEISKTIINKILGMYPIYTIVKDL